MAKNKKLEAEVIEAVAEVEVAAPAEPKLPKFSDVIEPAEEDRRLILVTSPRNKNTKLCWNYFVAPAGADIRALIKTVSDGKLIILIDERYARKFVEEGKPLRGMASTISDFANKYVKVMGVEAEDKAAVTRAGLEAILKDADNNIYAGEWINPKVLEAEEEAAKAEAEAEPEAEIA